MAMDFLKPAKYFFTASAIVTLASIVLLVYPGPKLSIEFTGGTRMELLTDAAKTQADVMDAIESYTGTENLNPIVNKLEDGRFIVRMKGIDDTTRKTFAAHLETKLGQASIGQYTTIGPTVGATLKVRAMYALLVASLGIIVMIAFSFRKIPQKYSPWKFGIVAVATLLHSVIIVGGVFTILSYTTEFEVDTLFVTALLTILGYCVNDTIVIFDRIRDNLFLQERKESFAVIANRSMNQVWKRSMFTGTATLIMLASLFLLGSASIKWFILTLIMGIVLGTYSSIFVATPLLVYWNERSRKQ